MAKNKKKQPTTDEFYAGIYGRVYGFLIRNKNRYELNEEIIKEVTQITVYELLKNIEKGVFRYESSVETYAISIAINQVRKWHRDRKYLVQIDQEEFFVDTYAGESSGFIMDINKAEILKRGFEMISKECRRLLKMILRNHSHKSIREKLKMSSPEYTRKRIYLCKKRLIEELMKLPDYLKIIE